MRDKNNIFWGLLIVALAIYILCAGLGVLPKFPIVKLGFTAVFVAWAINGLIRKDFVSVFLPLGLIGCQYDEFLGIEAITPWILILVSVLLGVGCNMVLGKKAFVTNPKSVTIDFEDSEYSVSDGDNVKINSSFGDHTQYINNGSLKSAKIENAFGKHTVYMTNALVHPNGAYIEVENSFGETTIYIPRNWNVILKQESAFGNIDLIGRFEATPDSPSVNLKVSCSFGNVKIYAE